MVSELHRTVSGYELIASGLPVASVGSMIVCTSWYTQSGHWHALSAQSADRDDRRCAFLVLGYSLDIKWCDFYHVTDKGMLFIGQSGWDNSLVIPRHSGKHHKNIHHRARSGSKAKEER